MLLAVFERRQPGDFPENPAKIKLLRKAHERGDFADRHIGARQHRAGVGHAQKIAVLDGTFSRPLLKDVVKVPGAHAAKRGVLVDFVVFIPILP